MSITRAATRLSPEPAPLPRILRIVLECKEVKKWMETSFTAYRSISPTGVEELSLRRKVTGWSFVKKESFINLAELVGEPEYYDQLGECFVFNRNGRKINEISFGDTIIDERPDCYQAYYRGEVYAPNRFREFVKNGGVFRRARYLFFYGSKGIAEVWEIDKKRREVSRYQVDMAFVDCKNNLVVKG